MSPRLKRQADRKRPLICSSISPCLQKAETSSTGTCGGWERLTPRARSDLAALVEESDSSSEVDPEDLADAGEAAVNGGVAENAWLPQEVVNEEQSSDSAYFSTV
nr:unnamed protein product [Callosobruchus analis]